MRTNGENECGPLVKGQAAGVSQALWRHYAVAYAQQESEFDYEFFCHLSLRPKCW